jgi:predicted metal-dependent peptidase
MTAEPAPGPSEARPRALATLEGDRAALLVLQPFLAHLALRLELVVVEDERLRTVATDGERLFCDLGTVLGASQPERLYLMAHSVWHVALLHPWRRRSDDRGLWDVAIDHEVNSLLEEQLGLPPDCVWFEERAGQSAEQIHGWLLEDPNRAPSRGHLADQHLSVRGSAEPSGVSLVDPAYVPLVSESTRHQWHERMLVAAQQLRARGVALPEAVERILGHRRASALPWPRILRDFVASAFGDRRQWLPPNRRFVHRSLYLPSRRSETLRLALAIDTSASTRPLQAAFWAEIVGIVRAYDDYELSLIQGDDRVRSVQRFSRVAPPDPEGLEFYGLGATDFRPIFETIGAWPEPPRALVFLTDGLGPAPASAPGYPVLWVLPVGATQPCSWGGVVRIPGLEALSSE